MAAIKVGIIGIGRHGSRYAEHIINDCRDLELVAVSRRSAEGREQAGRWRCRFYSDWRQLVDDRDVEAVIAVTTPNLNPVIARHCAGLGKALLVEKPLSTDVASGRQLLDCCGAIPLTVGQTLRFNPVVRGLRDHFADIGVVHSFHASQRLEKTLHPWLDVPEIAGAGVILHTAVHMFDALRFITGREIRRVKAIRFCRHNACLEDLFLGMLEMEDGLVGTIDASKVGTARCGRYEFVGEDGQLHGDQVHGTLERIRGADVIPLQVNGPSHAIVPLLEAWAAFLAGQGDNPVSGEDGLAAVQIAEACLRSADQERWVNLDGTQD